MSVSVHHEPKNMSSLPAENCCSCGNPTRYWYGTGQLNVALCPNCAPDLEADDLPKKAAWMAGAVAKRRERKEKQK